MKSHPDLPYEKAKNKEYLEKLARKLAKNPLLEVSRNVIWIDAVDHQIRSNGYHHPLLGRVGCDTSDEDLRDFYIGSRFIQDGDIQVYSWAAPIARLFFQPDCHGGEDVVVRRTYSHRVDDISDVDDEWVREVDESPFASSVLHVPAPAPSSGRRSRRGPDSSLPATDPMSSSPDEADQITPPPHPFKADPVGRRDLAITEGMRAKDAVQRRLAAPRQDRLLSVLALLQPDQHELVSWPVGKPLVVQGHPGTGKTIVAAYRAAYLVNPALYDATGALKDRSRPLRVLLVGPTEGYVHHVEELIRPLATREQVRVTDLAELLAETTGIKGPWPGSIGGEHDDVDAKARLFAEKAARHLEATHALKSGPGAARENVKAVFGLIASNGTKDKPLVNDPDLVAWMKKLPAFDQAFKRRHLALMAQCRLAYKAIPETDRYDHIVVDEAQDISPIEWNVLDQHLKRDGHWTLVGDLNQRRSDTTYGSWREIAEHLALTDDDDAFTPQVMERGYRSTGAILKFADKLLPARQRGSSTVQDEGEPVRVVRVTRAADLAAKAIVTAAELGAKHADGTTGIITVDPGSVMSELGRTGWRRPGAALGVWQRDSTILRLYVPENARGLEFDAVVVVEPGAFPENLGRTGQLYTSLTRANRELVVVWHRDLPDPLRREGRR